MAKLKRPATTIMLHPARTEQLRQLARNKGVSVVELIERFINRSIDEGDLEDSLPDFPVWARGKKVVCKLGPIVLQMAPPAARAFADLILLYVNLEKDQNSKRAMLSSGSSMMVRRAGRGLVIIDKGEDGTLTQASMTLQMARDIARHLLKEADLADKNS